MRNLYEKQGVLFSLIWIFAYAFVMAPVKDIFGTGNIWSLLALLAFASVITVVVKANHLEEKCGIARWPANTKACLYFIPMWVLATGNLWFGIVPAHQGTAMMTAALSMILVGYVEEMIFRGFLFRAMLASVKPAVAITVSALTFGMGHIVNLFAGQAGLDTMLQIAFAICWGFILTMVFYKSGSLIPCIIAHAMIDVFSLFAADSRLGNGIYTGTTAVGAIVYCVYLGRMRIQAEK